jgi:predicted GNAT family N-acyltransferase
MYEHNGRLRPEVLPAEELRRRVGVAEELRGEGVGEELVKTWLPLRYLDGE